MAYSEQGAKNEGFVKKRKPNSAYTVKKRVPQRQFQRKNDVYITNKTSPQSQLSHCEKLLESGESEIFIYGLGSAVTRAVNLALQLKDKYPEAYELSVHTSTVDIIDDLEPTIDQVDYDTQTRQNSSVRIRVFRTQPGSQNS